MSRSRRHTPICGWTSAESEKWDKKYAHKKLRQRERQNPESEPTLRDVSDVWLMEKDGKQYFDISKYPEGMRK